MWRAEVSIDDYERRIKAQSTSAHAIHRSTTRAQYRILRQLASSFLLIPGYCPYSLLLGNDLLNTLDA